MIFFLKNKNNEFFNSSLEGVLGRLTFMFKNNERKESNQFVKEKKIKFVYPTPCVCAQRFGHFFSFSKQNQYRKFF